MAELPIPGRRVFKVFNQDFIVEEPYTVTKELGQGAYGIVWYVDLIMMSRISRHRTLALTGPFFAQRCRS